MLFYINSRLDVVASETPLPHLIFLDDYITEKERELDEIMQRMQRAAQEKCWIYVHDLAIDIMHITDALETVKEEAEEQGWRV